MGHGTFLRIDLQPEALNSEQWRQRRADTCPPQEISFSRQFLDLEKDEEQTSSLATVLAVLRTRWSRGFKATRSQNTSANQQRMREFKAALEQASGKMIAVITATIVTWRLKGDPDYAQTSASFRSR